MQFEKPGVLITGGSKGLGRALAKEFASRDARVVVVARRGANLTQTVEEIRSTGAEAYGIEADVGSTADAPRIALEASARIGAIDILIHNASTLGPTPLRPLSDLEPDEVRRVFEVNVFGPFRLSHAILGSMVLRGRGLIVGISSDAAIEAYANWGPYGASKAALDQLLRIWAAELRATGVKVVVVDPGEMDTAMHRAAVPDADPGTLQDPARVAASIVDFVQRGGDVRRVRIADFAHPDTEVRT